MSSWSPVRQVYGIPAVRHRSRTCVSIPDNWLSGVLRPDCNVGGYGTQCYGFGLVPWFTNTLADVIHFARPIALLTITAILVAPALILEPDRVAPASPR